MFARQSSGGKIVIKVTKIFSHVYPGQRQKKKKNMCNKSDGGVLEKNKAEDGVGCVGFVVVEVRRRPK